MVKISLLFLAASAMSAGAHARFAKRQCGADLFDENFDDLAVGPPVSTTFTTDVSEGTGTLEVLEDGANKFLRITTQGNGRGFINVAGLTPPGNSFFGRARVRVVEYPIAPNFAHWILVEATGANAGDGLIRPLGGQFFDEQKGNFFGVGSDLGPTGDWTKFRQSAPAVNGAWQCLEFQMNNTDSSIAVSIDGVENPDLTVSKNAHGGPDQTVDFIFPQFKNVKFGWQLFQGGSVPDTFTVDMDDLALSTTRIAC